mmetsp:Transcript_21508/g.52322  ORF Transcript_21508/g.52322 Transcript_21508/m.52322 type:complete len:151 (-) Transcript_21508:98-550(-)
MFARPLLRTVAQRIPKAQLAFVPTQRLVTVANRPRWFCAPAASPEDRVVKAVEKFIAERKEDLKWDLESEALTAEDKEKAKAQLDKLSALPAVTPTMTWEEAGFDDLDCVEVLLEVEDEFDHIMPDEEADSIKSVQQTIEYIKAKVQAAA